MKTLTTSILFLFAIPTFAQQKFTINFDFNKYEINENAKQKLDSFIQSSPTSSIQKIDLYGHCDAIGNNAYNDQLSNERVNAVKEYLLAHNISQNIFDSVKGFGKRQPLNNNSTDEERLQNRRVEITIQRNTAPKPVAEEIKNEKQQQTQQTLTEKIKDTATKTGTNIVLKNLHFIGGRHYLMQESLPVLTELLNALKDNPSLEIEIDGHICCTFGAEDGIDIDTNTPNLSVNRAKAIYDYLIQQGISPQRLSYKGLAHRMPLVYPEDTEERRTTNRRVEIKILKK